MRFFSYDSKFGQLFMKLSYGCCLNVLWLICSLPIITIGASTTALYYTSFKIAKNEGSFITTMFFRSFKQNFKQATIIWMIMLATGLLIAADAILLSRLRNASTGAAAVVWTLMLAVIFACMIAYAIELAYIFPLLSIASNTTANMFKNAFLFGTHYLFVTILVFAIHYAMFFLVVNVFTPLIIFGEGLCAVISAHLMLRILRPHLYDPNATEAEDSDPSMPKINKLPLKDSALNDVPLNDPGPGEASQNFYIPYEPYERKPASGETVSGEPANKSEDPGNAEKEPGE